MITIAIIDTLGLVYDGNSLGKKGLGGSESAVILLAKELQNLKFSVTVFNNCLSSSNDTMEGVFDDVTYHDLSALAKPNDFKYDIVISSRSFLPFAKEQYWNGMQNRWHPSIFKQLKDNAKFKFIWMHDTFCWGDQLLEEHLLEGHVDEIFTLSDFHTSYVSNCDHGNRRNFEVLKNKIFITRNGAVNYKEEVDISKKERNVFVYNASVSKGMVPLIGDVWPKIKEKIPEAKLKVIGGFYKFRDEDGPDEQENKFWQLYKRPNNKSLDIEFTGIIKQSEIAEILSTAGFFLYPAAFPETFGISSLEALLYNTPIITCRFGALEETALNLACYFIDYAIEPNGLFPNINKQQQVDKFVNAVIQAYSNPYLHQQKMYYCNIVKKYAGWDSVALQWKQHIFKKLNLHLNVDQYRKIKDINYSIHKIFGRKFSNNEEWYEPKSSIEQKIVIVSPFYNAENYIQKCILSVASQDYENYTHYLIDDNSTDNSLQVIGNTLLQLPERVRNKFVVLQNTINKGAVYNQINTIKKLHDNDIVMLLDGDDWLYHDNDIFDYYNNLFANDVEFAYGSCWSVVDNIPLISQPYPKKIRDSKDYFNHKFNWGIPYTHLRVFKKYLINQIDESVFKNEQGEWFKAGGDVSTFYNIIEQADPNKIYCSSRIVYFYNDTNPLNDYKVNSDEQTKNAKQISNMKTKRFSVVVPTMWRCQQLFEKFLNDAVDHELIDEIIIINNSVKDTPKWSSLSHFKIRMLNQKENIKVNPAWNLGVAESKNDMICVVNDDITFDMRLFDKIKDKITPENGTYGIVTGGSKMGQPEYTNGNIDFVEWTPGKTVYGFGQLFFVHKSNWTPIIDGLDIYYGDDFTFHAHLVDGLKNYMITNIDYQSIPASTSGDMKIVDGHYEKEKPIFQKWFTENPIPSKEEKKVKTILIGIPTAKYIETETFKSIYDLEVPEGYKVDFQYFYGYNIDQIRNLIAHWAANYDYLFSVDSDIAFAKDTLKKMLAHNKDMVSGIYRQRKPDQQILEIYTKNEHGGVTNIPFESIKNAGLFEIESCGFGCVLVKSEVIRAIGYPQFVYKSALDHKDTISEDIYFCKKAKELGYKIYADSSIICDHIGATVYKVK